MSNIARMMQRATAGAGGAGLDVDEVFSTYCYTGDSSSGNEITGIDTLNEGGLVWLKWRSGSNAFGHAFYDTARGNTKQLRGDTSAAESTTSRFTGFLNNGFSLSGDTELDYNGDKYVAWTFRKAPKFFDVVTYTGNGVAGRTISHDLDNLVGMLMIKCTSHDSDWSVQHRMLLPSKYLALNETTSAQTDTARFHSTAAGTSTFSVGSGNAVNGSGRTYVAYLFSHNNNGNPGEFGPDSDQDIIKCGSYTGTGSEMFIDLGFEPQWILTRRTDTTDNWFMVDTMRGIVSDGGENYLWADTTNAEQATSAGWAVNPTGFTIESSSRYASGGNYIYMAIRRGPLAAPTDATKVFAMDQGTSADPAFLSGFPVDMGIFKNITNTQTFRISSRLTQGEYLETSETNAAQANTNYVYDYQSGFFSYDYNSSYYSWMWKRAPSYFDVVAWTGNDTAGRTVAHNLGVVPEMIWVKNRSATVEWVVYHKDVSNGFLKLNTDDAKVGGYAFGAASNNDAQSATNIILSSGNAVNELNKNYIGYLFATVAGISKVGSYNGNGSSQTIDCGFSNGARFVLIKRYDGSGEWYLFDTQRGITNDNDSLLELNNNAAEGTSNDFIDPQSSGFIVNGHINQSSQSYIFYAIA